MRIDDQEPGRPTPPSRPGETHRVAHVTPAEMERWSERTRKRWEQYSEEDRVLWKLIHDEVKRLMQGPRLAVVPDPAHEDDDADMKRTAQGLMRALVEEWEQDRWEDEEGLDDLEEAEDLEP